MQTRSGQPDQATPRNDADERYESGLADDDDADSQRGSVTFKTQRNELLTAATLNGQQAIGLMEEPDTMDNTLATSQQRPLVPLATLSALLGALYASGQAATTEFGQQQRLMMMPSSQPLLSAADKEQPRSLMSGPHLIQVSALLLAVAGAFLAVKLVMRGRDERMLLLRRNLSSRSLRSYWSFGSNSLQHDPEVADALEGDIRTADGKVIVADAGQEKSCKAANFERPEIDSLVSSSSGSGDERKKRNLEQLSWRLANILSGFARRRSREYSSSPSTMKPQTDLAEESQLVTTNTSNTSDRSDSGVSEDDQQQPQTPYRSSRSYIKALIDVLSKARPFAPPSSECCDERQQTDELDLESSKRRPRTRTMTESGCAGAGEFGHQHAAAASSESSDDGLQLEAHGVLLSQMDITAAHLILSYMESHLEDKERLRREWLQLNSSPDSPTSSSAGRPKGTRSGKMGELALKRLAKVALSEQNFHKNRDPSIVAFDRNRVRLNQAAGQKQPQPQFAGKQASRQQRALASSGSSSSQPGDYINASFIYDEQPNRPTHIIAQGPLEQTAGHFWQVSSSSIQVLGWRERNWFITCAPSAALAAAASMFVDDA